MPIGSHSGHLYSMNVINDYSNYVWSLPLKLKLDAAKILQGWHRAVENHERLVPPHGINHQHTAPYTSAQNSHVECLHCMILSSAHSMRLTCNASASIWDEFCAMAAYLANFMASSSITRKTPHKLWFGKIPSPSYLQEIGCCALH